MKVARNILFTAVAATAILEFYVAFYHRDFHRAQVILEAGLFMGVMLFVATLAALFVMRGSGAERRGRGLYVLVLPPAVLASGWLAEILIFRLGGVHYFWLFGAVLISLVISLFLDAHDRIKHLIHRSIGLLESLYRQAMLSLNMSLEAKEPYNRGHNERVAWYALQIARRLQLPEETCQVVVRAALLHDLGKIGISDQILLKEGDLSEEDWRAIRGHPAISERILRPLTGFKREMTVIRHHHEHMDGSGYGAVVGEDIPIESRVIAVADAFDAMTTSRPYRPACEPAEAMGDLRAGSRIRHDPVVVDAFSGWFDDQERFERPDYRKVREEMKLLGWDPFAAGSIEVGLLDSIRSTSHKMSLLERFYRLMGLGEMYIKRRIFYALTSGILLGVFVGLAVYSTERNGQQFLSFFLQGLLGGFVVLFLGATTESLLLRRTKTPLWRRPAGRALVFFPAGLVAGAMALVLVHLPFSPAVPRVLDWWNLAYIVFAGLFAGGVAYLVDFTQKASTLLLVGLGDLERLYFQLIYSLAFALEAKDAYSRGHSERVADYAVFIGEQMGLGDDDLQNLKLAALFHDIGKIGVRLAVLHKEGDLTEKEHVHMERHPVVGAEIIASLGSFARVAQDVRHHHEHFDGSGYPDNQRGDRIPLFSRIVAVADALDALMTDRPYRQASGLSEALAIIGDESGTKFDPEIVGVLTNDREALDALSTKNSAVLPRIGGVSPPVPGS